MQLSFLKCQIQKGHKIEREKINNFQVSKFSTFSLKPNQWYFPKAVFLNNFNLVSIIFLFECFIVIKSAVLMNLANVGILLTAAKKEAKFSLSCSKISAVIYVKIISL